MTVPAGSGSHITVTDPSAPTVAAHPVTRAGAGFGALLAGAVGCSARLNNNVWVNAALSYAPSVDTEFGSTSSVAGRMGAFWQF